MQKWMIRLQGDPNDLELLSEAISGLESHRIERVEGEWFISSSVVNYFDSDAKIREHAKRMLTIIRGYARVYAPVARDVACTDYLVKIGNDGSQSATDIVRVDYPFVWRVEGTRAKRRFAADVVDAATDGGDLELLAIMLDREPTWVELYKMLELIKKAVPDIPPVWATAQELVAFCASANHPAVSGPDSRHGFHRGAPPRTSKHKDIAQARELVLRLVGHWLESRDETPRGSG